MKNIGPSAPIEVEYSNAKAVRTTPLSTRRRSFPFSQFGMRTSGAVHLDEPGELVHLIFTPLDPRLLPLGVCVLHHPFSQPLRPFRSNRLRRMLGSRAIWLRDLLFSRSKLLRSGSGSGFTSGLRAAGWARVCSFGSLRPAVSGGSWTRRRSGSNRVIRLHSVAVTIPCRHRPLLLLRLRLPTIGGSLIPSYITRPPRVDLCHKEAPQVVVACG